MKKLITIISFLLLSHILLVNADDNSSKPDFKKSMLSEEEILACSKFKESITNKEGIRDGTDIVINIIKKYKIKKSDLVQLIGEPNGTNKEKGYLIYHAGKSPEKFQTNIENKQIELKKMVSWVMLINIENDIAVSGQMAGSS
jgi:hypothetical protein